MGVFAIYDIIGLIGGHWIQYLPP